MKCIACKTELESTSEKFTGTCNDRKGQYLLFYYCPNKECIRFKLFCEFYVREYS